MEHTPDQKEFIKTFTEKRDTLTFEVGVLTTEKESLQRENSDLSAQNSRLKSEIETMHVESARKAVEENEKINALKLERSILQEEIKNLTVQKKNLSDEISEKQNTVINLGILIKSIQSATSDTTEHIKRMGLEINVYSGRVESAVVNIEKEAGRVKGFVDELGGVVDKERKHNYEKSREIDMRELAVINREKLVDMKYKELKK